jgi:hypothetical protein
MKTTCLTWMPFSQLDEVRVGRLLLDGDGYDGGKVYAPVSLITRTKAW